jgi:hypothetical protein
MEVIAKSALPVSKLSVADEINQEILVEFGISGVCTDEFNGHPVIRKDFRLS